MDDLHSILQATSQVGAHLQDPPQPHQDPDTLKTAPREEGDPPK